jgi:hypothetical protein
MGDVGLHCRGGETTWRRTITWSKKFKKSRLVADRLGHMRRALTAAYAAAKYNSGQQNLYRRRATERFEKRSS